MTASKPNFNHYAALRLWSALTHGAGAILALVGTTILVCQSLFFKDYVGLTVFSIYGCSMIGLYTASTLYHSINGSQKRRMALRKYDHCSIYLLIAGSYTPICIVALANTVGYALVTFIWICAIIGVILTAVKLNIPRWVSSVIYLAMGWMAIFAIVPLSQVLSFWGMTWLLTGGAFYTIGGVMYATKWPGRNNPRFGCHEIFHLFILLGSIAHFFMMLCL